MLIKIKMTPDNEIVGDMGTCYIVTEHKGFIEALESITDYKVMPFFLDDNEHCFTELVVTPSEFDKEIDFSAEVMRLIQDNTIPFRDKIARREDLVIPKVLA